VSMFSRALRLNNCSERVALSKFFRIDDEMMR
jgi:hypothetical protein